MAESAKFSVKDFFHSLSEFEKESLYIVDFTNSFKKDVKLCYKRNLDLKDLETAIKILAQKGTLPPEYRSHPLKGYRKKENEEIMECHIHPDWLLIWVQNDRLLTLALTETGTHADLFVG